MERLIKYIEHFYDLKCVNPELSEEEQEELDVLEYFIKNFDYDNLAKLADIDKKKLVIAMLAGTTEDGIFSRIKNRVNLLSLDGIMDIHKVFDIHDIMLQSIKDKKYEYLPTLPYDYHEDSENVKEIKDAGMFDQTVKLNNLLKLIAPNDEAKDAYFELYEKYSANFIFALLAVSILNDSKIRFETAKEDNHNDNRYYALNPNKDNWSYEKRKRFIKEALEICHIDSFIKDISSRIGELKRLPRERTKNNNSWTKKKEKIIDTISSYSKDKVITLSPGFLNSLDNPTIKYHIIRRAFSHNLEIQKKTIEELKQEELTSKLERLFKKSCFSIDDLTEEEKVNLSSFKDISEIEKMLNLFTESNIKIYNDSFPIYDILMLSKPSIISNINKLIEARVITPEFALKNPSIYVEEIDESLLDKVAIKDGYYERLLKNIDLLKEKKFDTFLMSKADSNLLLEDTSYLLDIVNLVTLYNIDFTNSNNYNLLTNPSLIEIVDKYIELGLFDYIRKRPYSINKRSNTVIDRLTMCKELDIPLLIDDKLNPKVLQKDFRLGKNIISDNSLSSFISNVVPFYIDKDMENVIKSNKKIITETEEIPLLAPYAVDDYTYDFDGVIISRLKVLRNYHLLKDLNDNEEKVLFNSIIYGSTLDDEKIEKILNIINKNNIKKMKKC